jgi:hypothetical protein
MFKSAPIEPPRQVCVLPEKMTATARKIQRRHYAINRLRMIKRKAKMKVMYKRRRQMDARKKLTGNLVQKTIPADRLP